MEFLETYNIVKEILNNIGTTIRDVDEYDGIIVKKLSLSNTLDGRAKGKQTHIAITGEQMDIFPCLKSYGYFYKNYNEKDEDLKKYFTLRIPIELSRANLKYLVESDSCGKIKNKIDFQDNEWVQSYSHTITSRRNNAGDQLQISLKNNDDINFIKFRKLIHENDFLIVLKIKETFYYQFYGVRLKDSTCSIGELSILNNKFKKIDSITFLDIKSILQVEKYDKFKDYKIKMFKKWMKDNGLKIKSINNYISAIKNAYKDFKVDIFDLDYGKFDLFYNQVKNNSEYNDIIKKNNNYLSSALKNYYKFTKLLDNHQNIKQPYNRIIFGAPGTGKSYKLNKDIEENQLKDSFERVTFHPNYTFSQFVGSYKPVSRIKEGSDEKEIRYEFVPGPFLRVLVDSLNDQSNGTPHVLIIEEINRANPAVVFGDVFQLLDRDETGKSVYSINIPEEIKEYLESQQISIQQLYIPSNMYIWATMNSADQGVYPMDSAFKRRWSFEYIDIDENQENIAEKKIELKSSKDDYKTYRWNELRIEINKVLKKAKVNEDKLLGPFFLSKTELSKTGEEFDNIFKSKVLMYLYEDILKHKKIDLFVKEIKVSDEEILQVNTLSDIMKAYDNGKVFNFSIKEIDNTILNTNKNNLINYNNKEETVVNNEYEYEEGKENFDKVAEEQAPFNLE